jgi:phosphoserine phosphatase
MSEQPAVSETYDIYDFDHTIYDGDCSLDFYKFCLRKNPSLIRFLPVQILHLLCFKLKLESRTAFKAHFFGFLCRVSDINQTLDVFWDKHYIKIKKWYIHTDHTRDIIISASPEFLLLPAATKLGVLKLIATRMDARSGIITGKNCRGEEKVARLRAAMGNIQIGKVYTDHKSDKPLLDLAQRRYIVKKNHITELTYN